jgi:hypothetical protein
MRVPVVFVLSASDECRRARHAVRGGPDGISGTVSVEVALDATGAVVSATVLSSPSPILNPFAIFSAEHSSFSPTYFRCRPIAARYGFLVEFQRQKKAKN